MKIILDGKEIESGVWKVLLALILLAGLIGFVIVPQVRAASSCFPDVSTSHWAEPFICFLKNNGITGGYSDGTYRPGNTVTRAEMAVFIKNIYDLTQNNDSDTLAGLSCAKDEIAKWNGSSWECQPDDLGFSKMGCQTVQTSRQDLDSWYTYIPVDCPSGTSVVTGGYDYHNWSSGNQCIPIENKRYDSDTWQVTWASPTENECASNEASTWALCCP